MIAGAPILAWVALVLAVAGYVAVDVLLRRAKRRCS